VSLHEQVLILDHAPGTDKHISGKIKLHMLPNSNEALYHVANPCHNYNHHYVLQQNNQLKNKQMER